MIMIISEENDYTTKSDKKINSHYFIFASRRSLNLIILKFVPKNYHNMQ
jgi:hypothetical protein